MIFLWQLPQNIIGFLLVKLLKAKKRIFNIEHGFIEWYFYERKGWFYLLIIGIPSVINNIWDRTFHKNWNRKRRLEWYYSRYPEKQADELGGVARWI